MKRLFREQLPKAAKKIEAVLLKSMETEVSETEEDRTLKFVISNEAVDSYNDVVSSDGWDLKRYEKNPVVLWAHNHREPPVAKAVSIGVEGKNLVAEAKFADAETYEFADTVFKLLKGGFLKATSVGFFPKEWSYDEERGGYNLIENELFEFSIVPVPANPEALQLAVKSGIDIEPLRSWAEEVLTAPMGDHDPDPILDVIDVKEILKSMDEIADEEPGSLFVDSLLKGMKKETGEADPDAELEVADDPESDEAIDALPKTVAKMSDEIENLKAQVDQLLAKIAADEEEAKESEADDNALFDVIDINPIDASGADEVSRSIVDLEINPEELQAAIRRQLEREFMKTTGKLPKEV